MQNFIDNVPLPPTAALQPVRKANKPRSEAMLHSYSVLDAKNNKKVLQKSTYSTNA
jgi:hypothetical protein